MKFRPSIGRGDYATKTRWVRRWLDEGHDVKLTVMFRGREAAHPEFGRRLLDPILEWDGVKTIGNGLQMNGRDMTVTIRGRRRPDGGVREPRNPWPLSPSSAMVVVDR